MSKSLVAQSLDYDKTYVHNSKYHLSQNTQETGGTTVELTPSTNPVTKFQLAPNVINFSRSILTFDVAPQNEGTTALSMYADNIPFIRSMSLMTSKGLHLMDITDFYRYTNVIFRRHNRPEHVMTWDEPKAGSSTGDDATGNANAVSNSNGFFEGLIHKSVVTSTTVFKDTGGVTRTIALSGGDGTMKATSGANGNGSLSSTSTNGVKRPNNQSAKSFNEPDYLITSTEAGALRGPYLRVRLPLSLISESILSLDKGLYFGDTLTLKIVWNDTTKISWKHTAVSDVATGSAVADKKIDISELYLYTAIEQNQIIIDKIMANFNSGMEFLCPFVDGTFINLKAGKGTVTTRYDSAQGDKIKRIYVVPFDTTGNKNLVLSHSNQSTTSPPEIGNIVKNFYCLINNRRRTEFNINCEEGQDYYIYRHLVKGSCIDTRDTYYYNWCHEENFLVDLPVGTNRDNHDDGLILDKPTKFDFLCETTAERDFYVYTVFQRVLTIKPNFIDFVYKYQ
eukprot:Lithocolla_globosa_v1_NODE_2382_length_2028_cov_59.174861.p1 type:complete len:508 gc:universal NODE_2382_length_2028_cov_59.174861:245-1768(+)